MSTSLGTITGGFFLPGIFDGDGNPVPDEGSARFTPVDANGDAIAEVTDSAGSRVYVGTVPVEIPGVGEPGAGTLSMRLLATDGVTSPTGFGWRADISLLGGGILPSIYFGVPTNSVQDLSSLIPGVDPGTFVPVGGFASQAEADSLDERVTVLEHGGSGSAVTSVNGHAGPGAVTLNAGDVGAQPSDGDLTTIAAIDSTQVGVIGSDGAGWLRKTYAQVKTALSLTKADVGLGNVDNTSDVNKPVSSATATALAAKADAASTTAALAAKADLVGGVVPTSQIPAIALTTGQVAANRAALLALSNVQQGDIGVISGTADKGTYILTTSDPTVFANWLLLTAPTDVVSSVNGQVGTVVLGTADVGAQPADPDLTAIAALDASTAGAIASDGAGWIKKTYAQLKTALALVKGDVGLGNVDNLQQIPMSYLDVDGTLAGNSDTAVASQKATKSYVDANRALTVATRTGNVTLTISSTFENEVDATGGTFTVTLPSTTTPGVRFRFKKIDNTGNVSIVAGASIDNLGTTVTMTHQFDMIEVESTSSSGVWKVVGGTRMPFARHTNRQTALTARTGSVTVGANTSEVNVCDASAGAFTVTLPNGASFVGYQYTFKKTDSSANAITINVASSGTIEGAASIALAAQFEGVTVACSAAGVWYLVARSFQNARSKTTVYTTTGTTTTTGNHQVDPRTVMIEAEGIGGGYGGGSGACVVSGTACSGGAGGPGGGWFKRTIPATALASLTVPYSVGGGSTGGVGVTSGAGSVPGSAPTRPGDTWFGANVPGTNFLAAVATANSTAPQGGQVGASAAGSTNIGMILPTTNTNPNGAAGNNAANAQVPGVCGGGGGGGGGISTAPAAFAGGTGSPAYGSAPNTIAAAGTSGGGAGGTGSDGLTGKGIPSPGSGGGGGGSNIAGNGGAGGAGGSYGGGGAGGGSCLNGSTSGAGGNGQPGVLVVREWF